MTHTANDAPVTVEETLRWYAENAAGCRKIGRDGDTFRQALDAEGGKRALAALTSAPAGNGVDGRFWLIVREPGMVPKQKGPFRHTNTAKVLREFMTANPRAFIDHLTVDADGTPWVVHGPEVLQMTDGRSMSVGRKHNARVRDAAEAALARPLAAVGERLPADVAELVNRIGRAEWGATDALDADGHGKHVADSVRITAAYFDQTEPQRMQGLYAEGTETVICHVSTSPNSPAVARALAGAWNHLCDLAALQSPPAKLER